MADDAMGAVAEPAPPEPFPAPPAPMPAPKQMPVPLGSSTARSPAAGEPRLAADRVAAWALPERPVSQENGLRGVPGVTVVLSRNTPTFRVPSLSKAPTKGLSPGWLGDREWRIPCQRNFPKNPFGDSCRS